MTYQIIITEEVANVAVTSESYPIIIEYNATSIAANTIYGNTEVSAYLASGTDTANIITTANISGAYILGNGSALTGIVAVSSYGNANVAANLAAFGSNPVSTTGNITAGYFAGNGSLLTNITGGNVTGTVANATYALNSNAATFATQATFATTANSVAGANVSGTVANATYALNANASTFADTVTTAAQPNITSVGILSSLSASGNITGSYFLGNGSQLTGIVTSSYGNANVAANLAAFATNPISTTGDITTGNLLTGGLISATGNVSGGNVVVPINGKYRGDFTTGAASGRTVFQTTSTASTAATFISAIPGPGHVGTGSTIGAATGLFSSNDAGNASIFGMYSHADQARLWSLATGTGNVNDVKFTFGSGATLAATVTQTGNISAVGNVSGNYFIGNGSTLSSTTGANVTGTVANATYATSAGSATTAATVTDAAQANITSVGTLTSLSVSGNITGGNVQSLGTVTAAGNLMSTQQAIVGTANVGTTGNIVVSGKNIVTDMAWLPDGGNAATAVNGRILVGTGWNGNNTHLGQQQRLLVNDSVQRSATSTSVQLFSSETQLSITGNISNSSFRQHGVHSRLRIGGGPMANTIALSGSTGVLASVAALQPNIEVGNVTPYFLGNTSIGHAALNGGFFTTHLGSGIGNAYGMLPGMVSGTAGNADLGGNITNYVGFSSNMAISPYITGNLYNFYHPNVVNSAQQTATGLGMSAAARRATNYYAFRNDDPFAQVQLGSLRTFHEYQHSTSTSGTVNIDKNNGQVQYIAPTANVTVGDFQNFVFNAVSSASNVSLANIAQVDTVTLVIQQGATPYTVTMPTGNAQIKYASGNSTVSSTANAATMVSVTATKVGNAATAGTGLYLVTVSPGFV